MPSTLRVHLELITVSVLFGVVLNQVLFTEGMVLTTPEHSAVVNSCIPTWTLIVATVAGQERLRRRKVFAIISALCGVLYLLGIDRILTGEVQGFSRETLVGDLLTAGNGLAFAIHLVMMRKIGRNLDPWTTTAILFVQGTLMIGLWSGPSIEAAHVEAAVVPPILWYALYTVLASTVLAYLLNTWALRHTNSSNVALYINVQPIVAASLNYAMGAPAPGHRFYVALALVAFGLWLQTTAKRAD
ncbi:MAG: drug/metabolite transporter (DMT)-like permease [Planctomycetota bacterium]